MEIRLGSSDVSPAETGIPRSEIPRGRGEGEASLIRIEGEEKGNFHRQIVRIVRISV